jgi:hypothetical protein
MLFTTNPAAKVEASRVLVVLVTFAGLEPLAELTGKFEMFQVQLGYFRLNVLIAFKFELFKYLLVKFGL